MKRILPITSLAVGFSLMPASTHAQPDAAAGEVFPNVRVDVESRSVEFDGRVPIVLDDPDAPIVYLEVIVCTPDSKEHETLVVADVLPSHVHAALLMIGLEPGKPGWWTWEGQTLVPHDPEGDRVRVEFIYADGSGRERTVSPSTWVRHIDTDERLPDEPYVFAGSRMIDRGYGREMYDADGTGVLIGLATFGSEAVAWPRTFSPDSATDEPVWVADPQTTPRVNTPVTVRLRPAG